MSDWKVPRNVMDQSDLFLHRSAAAEEDSAADPDADHLNGRETAEHERDLVLEARRAERQAAAEGILSGLIRKPPKL